MSFLEYHSLGTIIPVTKTLLEKCYLCGTKDNLEEEHIIPKVIFRPHYTDKFVKLSACRNCNEIKEIEDSAIPRLLQFSSFNENAEGGSMALVRGFDKGQQLGIKSYIERGLLTVPLQSKTGNTNESFAIKPPAERVKNFISNIIKGILVRNSQVHRDWNEYTLNLQGEQAIQSNRLYNSEITQDILHSSKYGEHWSGTFFYRYAESPDGLLSNWVIIIYDQHLFVATMINKEILVGLEHEK